MRKKLLIVVCALMMMFGTTLSVSAEETTTSNIKTTHYLYVKDDGAKFSTMYYNVPVKVLSLKVSDCTLHYFISNIPFQYASCEGSYDETITLEENIANYERYFYEVYTCNEESVNSYFNIGENDYFFKTIVFHDDNSDITECNYSYLSYNLSDSISLGESSAKDILYNFLLENSDILGDWYDVMTEDDTFGLTGFTADNTITASWTGTTHDDVIDTYNQADVGIRPWYYYKSAPEMMAFKDMVLEEYEISDKTFTKLYDELTYSDDTLFLRYLEVIPTYQKVSLGDVYKGKSCWIEFDADGNVVNIINDYEHSGGGSSDEEYDSNFYLIKVIASKELFSSLLNDPRYYISWRGTSIDREVLDFVDIKDTSVSVYCIGVNESGETKQYDYLELDPLLDNLTIRTKLGVMDNTYNDFEVNLDAIEANMLVDGFTFNGDFILVPRYKKNDRQYVRGCKTLANIYTGEVNNIIEDDDEEVVVPVTPPKEDDDEEEDDPELPDISGISDIPTYMLNLLKSFFSFVGYVPKLLGAIFPFLPSEIINMLSLSLLVAVVLRVLGR